MVISLITLVHATTQELFSSCEVFMTRVSSFDDGHIFIRRCCILHPLSFEFVIRCDGLWVSFEA
jgi:hypothetical protein